MLTAPFCIILLAFVSIVDSASSWTVTGSISDAQLNTARLSLTMRVQNSNANFDSSYAASPDAFPGNCVSSGSNTYGWKMWNASVATLAVTQRLITIRFAYVPGFAILTDETIDCTPATATTTFYSLSGTAPVSPTFYSFTITSASNVPSIVWTGSSQPNRDESWIRANGFELILALQGADVWLTSDAKKQQVLDAITSTSGSTTKVLQTQLGITTANMQVVSSSPNQLRIAVSLDQMAALPAVFDLGAPMTISYTPQASVSLKGVKPIVGSAGLSVLIGAVTIKPDVRLLDQNGVQVASEVVVFTEDCIRGVITCILHFGLVLQSGGTAFTPSNAGIFDNAFSPAAGFEAVLGNFTSQLNPTIRPGQDANGQSRDDQVIITLQTLPDLDVANASDFNYVASWKLFANLEPPSRGTKPFTIRITPSPTRVVATATGISQAVIWQGGNVVNISISGETFDQQAVLQYFADASTASYSDGLTATDNPDGWMSSRSTILGPTAFRFPNPSLLQLVFVQDVNHGLKSKLENVVLAVNGSMLASKLNPLTQTGLTFSITSVDPTLVVNGVNTFEEALVWRGEVSFVLTLAGDKWYDGSDFMSVCGTAMVKTWSSEGGLTGDRGWSDATVNSELMQSTSIVLPPSVRNLRVMWNASADYYTIRGEQIVLSAPNTCLKSGRTTPPQGTPTITILPQRAVASVYFVETADVAKTSASHLNESAIDVPLQAIRTLNGNQPPDVLPVVSESRVRKGGVTFVADLTYDRFDMDVLAGYTNFGSRVVANMLGSGVEATGWTSRRSFMIDAANVVVRENGAQILIPIVFYAPYTISTPERVELNFDPAWMLSRRKPNNSVAFYVQVSPGLVTVPSWLGSQRAVTEADLRDGSFYMNLWLLGDSWGASRTAFATSLYSAVTAKRRSYLLPPSANVSQSQLRLSANPNDVGIDSLKFALTPGTEMWRYSVSAGYSQLALVTQPAPTYDISSPETVVIDLQNLTVASQLSPTWLTSSGSEQVVFEFQVFPVAGELEISGSIHSVSEKTMRAGGSLLRLTLKGESFATNASTLIAASMSGSISGATGFNALAGQLIGTSAVKCTARECVVVFGSARSYSINTTEVLTLTLWPAMFASGIVPRVASVAMTSNSVINNADGSTLVTLFPISNSGGDISASIAAVNATTAQLAALPFVSVTSGGISESYFTGTAAVVRLTLDGDTWNTDQITSHPATFLSGFQSATPLYSEPNGFNANNYQLLQLGNPKRAIKVVDTSTVDVTLCLSCVSSKFDIVSVDELYYVLPFAGFVTTGVQPTPRAVTLQVVANPQWIVVVLSGNAGLSDFWSGQLTSQRFVSQMALFMIADVSQVTVRNDEVNGGKVVFQFVTTTDADVKLRDSRNAADLTAIFLALNTTFVRNTLAATDIYLEQAGSTQTVTTKPDSTLPPGVTAVPVPAYTLLHVTIGTWFASLVVLSCISVVFILSSSLVTRRNTPVGRLIKGSTSPQRSTAVSEQHVNVLAGDETAPVVLDELRTFRGQSNASTTRNPLAGHFGAPIGEVGSLRDFVTERAAKEARDKRDQEELGRKGRTFYMEAKRRARLDGDGTRR